MLLLATAATTTTDCSVAIKPLQRAILLSKGCILKGYEFRKYLIKRLSGFYLQLKKDVNIKRLFIRVCKRNKQKS